MNPDPIEVESSALATAFRKGQAMNLLLLDNLPAEALAARYSPTTRTVAAQMAHLHNVRVSHVQRVAPQLLGEMSTFPRGAQPDAATLRAALCASAEVVAQLLAQSEAAGKVKGWGGSPADYLAYWIAHESHHRGLILVSLRLSGFKLGKEVTYGLWGWRKKL